MAKNMEEGWSFCFVTGGTDDAVYADCLTSIRNDFVGRDDFEIISVGTSSLHDEPQPHMNAIEFKEPVFHPSVRNFRFEKTKPKKSFYRTGAISHKKYRC